MGQAHTALAQYQFQVAAGASRAGFPHGAESNQLYFSVRWLKVIDDHVRIHCCKDEKLVKPVRMAPPRSSVFVFS